MRKQPFLIASIICWLFMFLCLYSIVNAATYYMRSDGTASSGSPPTASGPCSTVGNTLNESNMYASTFSDGDILIMCDDGGDYGQFVFPRGGLTYQNETGDTPEFTFTGNWKMGAGVAMSDITLDGLTFSGNAQYGALYAVSVDNLIVKNCTFKDGIWANAAIYTDGNNSTITDNTFSNVDAQSLIYILNGANDGEATESLIARNTFDDCQNDVGASYNDAQMIGLFGADTEQDIDNFIVEDNYIYNSSSRSVTSAITVWNSEDVVIRRNRIQDSSIAITVGDGSRNIDIYNNVVVDNSAGSRVPVGHSKGFIAIKQTSGGCVTDDCYNIDNVKIYNNTIANNDDANASITAERGGILLYCNNDANLSITNLSVKNNIVFDNMRSVATYGAELNVKDDGDYISSPDLDYNLYFSTTNTSRVIRWKGTTYDIDHVIGTSSGDYSNDESQDANSVDSNPLFTNAGSDDFTLTSTSPAIDVGVDLGATYDDALRPVSAWPDQVYTADQDIYGAGWDIGAFIQPTFLDGGSLQ